MNYTDTQLKQALAKMLPEEVLIFPCGDLRWWPKHNGGINGPIVLDTELLHLCWLVEEGLTPSQQQQLLNEYRIIYWSIHHATWQQRTTALAKVKGIEIV